MGDDAPANLVWFTMTLFGLIDLAIEELFFGDGDFLFKRILELTCFSSFF